MIDVERVEWEEVGGEMSKLQVDEGLNGCCNYQANVADKCK